MTGLPERTVEVRGEKYAFRLVPARVAFNALCKMTSKVSQLAPNAISLWAHDNNKLNESIDSLITNELPELIEIFIDMEQLKVYNPKTSKYEFIGGEQGFDEHFTGKAIAIGELLYKIILENDKDFFHSFHSLAKKGMTWLSEKLQANSLKLPEEVNSLINETIQKSQEHLG